MALWDQADRYVDGSESATTFRRKNVLRTSVSQLALTTAIGLFGLPALSTATWAQCVPAGGSNFVCSGANTTPQDINAPTASVSTTPGFSVNTATGNALHIGGSAGSVSYTDTNASSLVTGNGFGLFIESLGSGSVVVQTNGAIQSSAHGIWAVKAGSNVAGISVTTTGAVTSTTGTGIQVYNGLNGNLTINAAQVSGNMGIFAENTGIGATSVTATGVVTGTNSYGILAVNGVPTFAPDGSVHSVSVSNGTNLTVNAASVTGGIDGIYAHNNGTGATSVTATGLVTGTTGAGIRAVGGITADGGMTVNAAAVNGGTDGISVNNSGSGATNVTATGHVAGAAADGISVVTNGAGTSVHAASASGATSGIHVLSAGTGTVDVTATGLVTGTAFAGISVLAGGGTTGLTVNAAAVSGGTTGIGADNQGSGINHVTATGTVTAGTGQGIIAFGGASGSDVLVDAVRVIGGTHGIAALNFGTGATRVVATGTATGSTYGIVAENGSPGVGTDISIDAVDVTGGVGIHAKNIGTGSTRVTATGHVEGTGTFGILAVNGRLTYNPDNTVVLGPDGAPIVSASTAVDLTVNAASVTGVSAGIYAYNWGTGTTSVTATGAVIANAANSFAGILAFNEATATGLTVNAASVSGAFYGIVAANNGSGATAVTATGDVIGGLVGIMAVNGQVAIGDVIAGDPTSNGPGGTSLTVNAATATGGLAGIYAYNWGSGATNVTATGLVQGGEAGIVAINRATATSLTVNAASIALIGGSGTAGIYAQNAGTGTTSVTATGDVNAASGIAGILAFNDTTATSLTVNAASAAGAIYGIVAANNGSGATSVTASGDAIGGYAGIMAVNGQVAIGDIINFDPTPNSPGGTSLTVNAATATGGLVGIFAYNWGSGATNVTATGLVQGGEAGIVAINRATATSLTVNAASVSLLDSGSGIAGIYAQNAGTGATSVTATGDVNAATGYAGILAFNDTTATSLTVNATSASGSIYGVVAANNGSGATAVTATGDAIGGLAGIMAVNGQVSINDILAGDPASNGPGGTSLTVNAATATGGLAGIFAYNWGSGATNVTATGLVQGGVGGIVAINRATATSLTVNAASAVGGEYGIVAFNSGTGTTNITASGLVEGGTSAILATSAGQAITITTSGLVRNRSQLSTDLAIDASGGPVAFTNAGGMIGTVRFGAGANTFANNADWNTAGGTNEFGGGASQLTNAAGVTIFAAANGGVVETTAFNGLANFVNHGVLAMADGGAGDRVTITGNARFEAGSTYTIDVNAAGQSDRVIVNGTATLVAGSTLAVNVQNGLLYGNRYTVLTADGGLTGTFGTVTGITNTAFLTIADAYDANNAYLDVLKYRNFADAGLTPNQISTGYGLDHMPTGGPLFNAVAGLMTDAQARAAFDQLSGEAHASISTALVEDSRFVRTSALDRLRSAFDAPGATRVPVMSYAPGGPSSVRLAPVERFAVWGQAYGSWGRWNGDGNTARLNRSTGGFAVGVDTPDFGTATLPVRVGLLAGYSNTGFSVGNRSSSGSSDNVHMGAYAGAQWNAFGLRAGVVHSWHDIRTTRSVFFNGFTDLLRGNYDARTTQVFGDLGYRIDAGRFGFEPFANLAYVNLRTNGFREMGGAAALTSQGRTSSVTFSTLGLRASSQFDLGGMALTARGTLGWRHAFGAVTPQAVFAFAGGTPFAISGIAIARDAAVVEAGLDLRITPAATLGVSYSGQFARAANDQSLKGNLALRF